MKSWSLIDGEDSIIVQGSPGCVGIVVNGPEGVKSFQVTDEDSLTALRRAVNVSSKEVAASEGTSNGTH